MIRQRQVLNTKIKQSGFTLVETIVMITIAGIVGVILTDTITQVYRSQNKTNSINQIKQNGQTALDFLDKTTRNSDKVVCLITYPSNIKLVGNFYIDSVLVVAKQGNFTRFMFRRPKDASITENGHIGVDYPDTNRADNDSDYCSELVPIVDGSVTRLTNSAPAGGISITSGVFSKGSQSGYKDVITVQFDASSGSLSQTSENNSSVHFKTAVELR